MKKQFLEAGKIVNTHGVHGQVKIQPWTSRPDFLCTLQYVYLDGKRVKIFASSVHKDFVIASLEGIGDIDDAIPLKNKILYIDRDDAPFRRANILFRIF
jgi:16S rRNA processing protein RimM